MPYSVEKVRLPDTLDRRRKVSDADRAEMVRLRSKGRSIREISRIFSVSRKTVSIIVDPDARRRQHEYNAAHWKKYATGNEEHARIIREHRQYKQSLRLAGKI